MTSDSTCVSRHTRNGWYYEQKGKHRSWRRNGTEIVYDPKRWYHLVLRVMEGLSEDGATLIIGLFGWAFYFRWPRNLKRESCWGIRVDEYGLRISFGSRLDKKWGSRSERRITMDWPWQRTSIREEILDDDGETVYTVYDPGYWRGKLRRLFRIKSKRDWWKEREAMEPVKKSVSKSFPYTYTRRNGEVQRVTATCYITRVTWAWQWLSFIRSSETSIWCNFDGEVGEGVDDWKGGTIGCGYGMRPGEKMEQTIRRMERDRKFNR